MCRTAIFASSPQPTLHTEALQVRLKVRFKYKPAASAHKMASVLVQDVPLRSAAALSAVTLAVVQLASGTLSSACGLAAFLRWRRVIRWLSDIVPLRWLSFPLA